MRIVSHILAALLVTLAAAREARACGGFFCNTPTPVDQTAEQIIFADENGKGATYVQIKFTGRADDFGWIVPVTQVPEKVETSDLAIFTELQQLTGPIFSMAASGRGASCSGGGCASETVAMADKGAVDPGVIELGGGTVGPYEWVAVTSTRADDLLKWLADRRYNVSDDAKDVVQAYLDEGAKFVALKLILTDGVDVSNLTPVKFTFPKFEPCVPLRLTRVSARPDMGVLVYVLGETRAQPERYSHVEVDFSQVVFDFTGPDGTNYRRLLGEAIDKAGGRAFTTEYAGKVSALLPKATGDATRRVLMSGRYLTRLYGVVSPEEMTIDPIFAFAEPGKLPDVANTHTVGTTALEGSVPGYVWPLLAGLTLRRRKARR